MARRPTISEQLRKAIADSGVSLTQIGEATGIDDGILSRYMRAERGLSSKTIDRLCQHFGLELRKTSRKGR